jgi:lipopolysaccharide transport system ATP-binding protein
MDNVAKQGRTILFVSHNMSTVESLCNRGILLESGGLHLDSTAEEAVKAYLDKAYNLARDIPLSQRKDRSGNGKIRVLSFRILNEQGQEEPAMQSGKNYYFEFGYINNTGSRLKNAVISLELIDEHGARILLLKNSFTNHTLNLDGDRGYIFCGIENLPVVQGLYRITIHLAQADIELLDRVEDAATVSVDGGDFFGTGSFGIPNLCKFLVKSDWYTEASQVRSRK